MPMGMAKELLSRDFEKISKDPAFQEYQVVLKDQDLFHWIFVVHGSSGTSWEGLSYDIEVQFNRRHPFEPPVVVFPQSQRNSSNPIHSHVDGEGRLRLKALSYDQWLPTIDVATLIGWVKAMFTAEPPSLSSGAECAFNMLSFETMIHTMTFLEPKDVCSFSECGRKLLGLAQSDQAWAMLYYRDSVVPGTLLRMGWPQSQPPAQAPPAQADANANAHGGDQENGPPQPQPQPPPPQHPQHRRRQPPPPKIFGPYTGQAASGAIGPLRTMSITGKWFWQNARESFIRTYQMRKAAFKDCPTLLCSCEQFALRELQYSMVLVSEIKTDIQHFQDFIGVGGLLQPQHRHEELARTVRLYQDVLQMVQCKITSLLRVLAFSGGIKQEEWPHSMISRRSNRPEQDQRFTAWLERQQIMLARAAGHPLGDGVRGLFHRNREEVADAGLGANGVPQPQADRLPQEEGGENGNEQPTHNNTVRRVRFMVPPQTETDRQPEDGRENGNGQPIRQRRVRFQEPPREPPPLDRRAHLQEPVEGPQFPGPLQWGDPPHPNVLGLPPEDPALPAFQQNPNRIDLLNLFQNLRGQNIPRLLRQRMRDHRVPHRIQGAEPNPTRMDIGDERFSLEDFDVADLLSGYRSQGSRHPNLSDYAAVSNDHREYFVHCFRRFRIGQKVDLMDPEGRWMEGRVLWAHNARSSLSHRLSERQHPPDPGEARAHEDTINDDFIVWEERQLDMLNRINFAQNQHARRNAPDNAMPIEVDPSGGVGEDGNSAPVTREVMLHLPGGVLQRETALPVDERQQQLQQPPPAPPAQNGAAQGDVAAAFAVADGGGAQPGERGPGEEMEQGWDLPRLMFGRPGARAPGEEGEAEWETRYTGKGIKVHYEGCKDSYDEWVGSDSWRLAPYRTRTGRPISLDMIYVSRLQEKFAKEQACIPQKDAMRVTLQCAWRGWESGGGMVRYSVAPGVRLDALRHDFCQIHALDFDHTCIVQVTHELHRDIRKNVSRAVPLDGALSLAALGVHPGAILDVILDQVALQKESRQDRNDIPMSLFL